MIAIEECDDGNTSPGDGCDPNCKVEPGWECEVNTGAANTTVDPESTCNLMCGNGEKETTNFEKCDDGNTVDGDGCTNCQIDSLYVCDNSLTEANEGTLSVCELPCGNGLKTTGHGEECDDSNTDSGDGCSPTCTIETGYICDGSSISATEGVSSICELACGNGDLNTTHYGEVCDDGN